MRAAPSASPPRSHAFPECSKPSCLTRTSPLQPSIARRLEAPGRHKEGPAHPLRVRRPEPIPAAPGRRHQKTDDRQPFLPGRRSTLNSMHTRAEALQMKKNGLMQRKANYLAVQGAMATLALSAGPVFADPISDLKAEIAAQRAQLDAQRAQLDAQRARLEAMEKKLDGATAQQAASAPAVAQQVASAPPAALPPAEAKSWMPKLVASAEWQPGFTFQV